MTQSTKRTVIFPGSFDPFTRGHHDLVKRAVPFFDELIIAIGQNSTKQRYFPLDATVAGITAVFKDEPKVKVQSYTGLTVHFAREVGAVAILRGLRNTIDFEYEKSVAESNRLLENTETLFLFTTPQYAGMSSTIVREIHKNGGDVTAFVPYPV